jgi:hypothetical protein
MVGCQAGNQGPVQHAKEGLVGILVGFSDAAWLPVVPWCSEVLAITANSAMPAAPPQSCARSPC